MAKKLSKSKVYFGLLGYPVKHSFSPSMHNAALKALNINAEYKLFEVKPQDLENFIESLKNSSIKGLNVTVPYKEKVFKFVKIDRKFNFLKKIGAINTLVVREKNLYGYNTDIFGFLEDLKEKGIEVKNKDIAILGAGGAARAVLYVLGKSKARSISIYDIDKEKSTSLLNLAKDLFLNLKVEIADSLEKLQIDKKHILINATPVGLKKEDPCLVDEKFLHKDLIVYDLIYNPPETKLIKLAKKNNLKAFNGLGMLLYQGALSFEYFTGKKAPIDIMKKALETEIKKIC